MSNTTPIKPTIGRRLWFWPGKGTVDFTRFAYSDSRQPCDAGIAYVHNDKMINITVADQSGVMHGCTSVPLIQPGETPPADGFYCEWMPYQAGQAKKSSAEDGLSALALKADVIATVVQAAATAAGTQSVEGHKLSELLLKQCSAAFGSAAGEA